MYRIKVRTDKSEIDGKGVFAVEDIPEGFKVWVFDPKHDVCMSKKEYEELSQGDKERFDRVGYLSPWTDKWIAPPKDDPAQYTNHSPNNNLSVEYNEAVSSEPFFVANRDIKAGEELTNNYYEFDSLTRKTKPEWAK